MPLMSKREAKIVEDAEEFLGRPEHGAALRLSAMTGKQLKERARARNAGGNATSKAGLVHRLIWAGDDGMPDEPPAAAGGGEASGTAHTARTTPPRKKARHSEAASADGVDDDDAAGGGGEEAGRLPHGEVGAATQKPEQHHEVKVRECQDDKVSG